GWPSGLRRTLGKRVYGKPYRGFESHSLRHNHPGSRAATSALDKNTRAIGDFMFSAMRIRNFRTFRTLLIEGLSKINLITGKNGTGKTAVLEAVFLNAGAANTSLCVSLESFRGGFAFSSADDSIFRNLFHRFGVATPIELTAEWQDPNAKTKTKSN